MQIQHNQSAISNPDYWLYLRERRFYDWQYCDNMDYNIYETSHESINGCLPVANLDFQMNTSDFEKST